MSRAPATRVLLSLSRPLPNASDEAVARALGAQLSSDQWSLLAQDAQRLRTSAWVLQHAQRWQLSIPSEARARLQEAARAAARQTIAADTLLARIESLLQGPRPLAMLIKGAVIEARAYPAGMLRPQVDVDIVARPGAMAEIVAWLRARGFTDHWGTRSGHELGLADPAGPSVVEVHRTIVCPYRFAPFAATEVSERLFATAQRDARGRLVPGDVEHTAFILLHLVEMVYADVRHVADAAAWLRTVSVDPAAVWAVAVRWQARRAVAAGLQAVEQFDPGALRPGWRSIAATVPQDLQSKLATGLRGLVKRYQRSGRAGRANPRWLEGLGLAAHLDRPVRFFGTYARPPRLQEAVGWRP